MKTALRVAIATIVATGAVGAASIGVAHASPTMSVTPSTGLTGGDNMHVVVGGLNTVGLPNVKIAQCANAEADGTPLSPIVPATDCRVFADATPSPSGDVVVDVPVLQTGIGTGNRSCLASVATPCEVKITESTNQPTLPAPVPLSFVGDPGPSLAATSTSLTIVGSPVGLGKTPHVRVAVSAPLGFIPQGTVTVLEGSTPRGTATLQGGSADVALSALALGDHTLVASFGGDGSFSGSTSPSGTMNIIEADNISIGDASIVEGAVGNTRSIVFPVVVSTPPTSLLTVDLDINAGTADVTPTAGADVIDQHKVLKFPAGKTVPRYILVKVVGDNDAEPALETFTVTMSNPTNGYVLRRPTGTGVIYDDDSPSPSGPRVEVGDSSVVEGDGGASKVLRFPVTLSEPVLTNTVTVTLQILPASALPGKKGTLTADWGGITTKRVNLKAGQVSKFLSVPAFPDLTSELDETLTVNVIDVQGITPAAGGRTSAVGTILSDE
jgi:hypothetical protein